MKENRLEAGGKRALVWILPADKWRKPISVKGVLAVAKKERQEYQISSVCKALTLLEQFLGELSELRVTDLSRLLHTSNNRVLRLLATLESRDFVEKNVDTGGYRLGLTTLGLSQTWINSDRLVAEGRTVLEQLSAVTCETVFLGVLRGESVIYADIVESTLPVRAVATPGTGLPLHSTAAGKLMLAHFERAGEYLETESLRQEGDGFALTLMRQVKEIRKTGYAIDVEEYQLGLCGVAAPVRNQSGKVVAAVSIVGPSSRLGPARLAGELAQLVMQAGQEISKKMGYKEPCLSASCTEQDLSPQKATIYRKTCEVAKVIHRTQVVNGCCVI